MILILVFLQALVVVVVAAVVAAVLTEPREIHALVNDYDPSKELL